jgi:hypothetical protein
LTPINLSNADTSGPDFTPIKPGTYPATVFEASWGETQGGAGSKLPKGTPFINVQFKIDTTDAQDTDGKDLTGMDRRAFTRYIIAPEKIGNKAYEHKAKMDGMLVRFLTAIGYDNDDVMSEDGYDPDLEDFGGRECAVVLAIEEYIPNDPDFDDNDEPIKKRRNVVKGVKKAGAGRGAVGKVGGII